MLCHAESDDMYNFLGVACQNLHQSLCKYTHRHPVDIFAFSKLSYFYGELSRERIWK